jgi:cell division protein FtsN
MKKSFIFFIVVVSAGMLATSCKSKQKAAEISGANQVVGYETPEPASNAPAPVSTYTTPAPANKPETELTRNETFSLSEGSTKAFKSKYHVVVGSFKSQANAKGLQSTLLSEGNDALIVVNEQGMFRVLIASYNEYAQARGRISQISNRFPDAWVLVQK